MLRLPPTSIDLSEKDLAFHLQQIDIYHGLLKQGFEKADILRYMNEHNQVKHQRPSSDFDNLSLASTVDLALINSGPTVAHVSPPPSDDAKAPPPPDDSDVAEERHLSPRENASSHVDLSQGPVRRHAPRQSSLLRFTELASHETENDTNTAISEYIASPRKYRPRTDTYSYTQSEISVSDLVTSNTGDAGDNEISPNPNQSTMRGDATAFVPSGDVDLEEVHQLLVQASPTRAREEPSTGQDFEIHQDEGAGNTPRSSPPAGSDSSLQPIIPSTPGHSRNTRRTRTLPRTQQLDGHFSVYNDALPSLSQPQTPFELERYPALEAYYAAYTAPPGMVHPAGRSRGYRSSLDYDPGAQTPTVRAIGTRERRARELRRSIRATTARLDRFRVQDDDGEEIQGANEADTSETDAEDAWRSSLDEDRVGDENWEVETMVPVGFEGGIRIVSGNTRIDG